MLQKVDDQRLLLNEYLGGKRRFQKEEFEKCEPWKPNEWKKSQDLQLQGLATLEFLLLLGLWWAHFSSSWSLWLWSSSSSTFFARFPKGWGCVFIPQRWGSIWSESHRLYRRFFVVIFRFVVLFCRLTRKTDHSAFEIYLYFPLEVFLRWLVAKIHSSLHATLCSLSKISLRRFHLGMRKSNCFLISNISSLCTSRAPKGYRLVFRCDLAGSPLSKCPL